MMKNECKRVSESENESARVKEKERVSEGREGERE
jgi:hypothetical protein